MVIWQVKVATPELRVLGECGAGRRAAERGGGDGHAGGACCHQVPVGAPPPALSTAWMLPAIHVLAGSGVKANLAAVVWATTVTVVDVPAVASPVEVAWTLRVPAIHLAGEGGSPLSWRSASVAPADGQPSEVAETVTPAVLVVTRFP